MLSPEHMHDRSRTPRRGRSDSPAKVMGLEHKDCDSDANAPLVDTSAAVSFSATCPLFSLSSLVGSLGSTFQGDDPNCNLVSVLPYKYNNHLFPTRGIGLPPEHRLHHLHCHVSFTLWESTTKVPSHQSTQNQFNSSGVLAGSLPILHLLSFHKIFQDTQHI